MIRAELDERSLRKADARLAKYQGRPLHIRAQRAYLEGARLLRGPLQRAAPRGPTGNLRRSISARANRLRPGEMAAATAGTRHRRAPHDQLVTGGTRSHSLARVRLGKGDFVRLPDGGVRRSKDVTHPGSKANPFVAEVTERSVP